MSNSFLSRFLSKEGPKEKLSIVRDPFNITSIESVTIHYSVNKYSKEREWSAWGTVSFENNKTSGTQRFDGKDIPEVYQQIAEFIKTL